MGKFIALAILLSALTLSSCGLYQVTRTERDVYTKTVKDTTRLTNMLNAPGARDNGTVYPSSRQILFSRELTQQDSIIERNYPDFIRLGLFEAIGTINSGDENAPSAGLFGLFPDFKEDRSEPKLFRGAIYRAFIYETRLRWFRDAENWTWGGSAAEFFYFDRDGKKSYMAIAPFYLRKRFFLSEEIPYRCITAAAGFGLFPSQYMNLSVSYDVGSIGGLNLRAYLGAITGSTLGSLTRPASRGGSTYQTKLYLGLGFSAMDFHNLPRETEVEWKRHEHSSWEIGLLQAGFVKAFGAKSVFGDSLGNGGIASGYYFKLINASVALPLLDYKLYGGVSLIKFGNYAEGEYALGVLPLRIGYWQTLIPDDLTLEPFIEWAYYPARYVDLGARLNLNIIEKFVLSFTLGFAGGEALTLYPHLEPNNGNPFKSFSHLYMGLSFSLWDRIFYPSQLRYNLPEED